MQIEHRELSHGSKKLDLDINWNERKASIRIGKRSSLFFPRIKGETTAIFLRADEIMSQRVHEVGVPIVLTFDTANTNMKLWAEARKDELGFRIEHDGDSGYRITVTKEYEVL